jgi:hypothetical protein
MKSIFFIFLPIVFVACHNNDNSVEQNNSLTKIKTISSVQFDSSVNKMVNDYVSLKNNFIVTNDSMINFYSRQLMKDADSLNFNGFQSDSAIVVQANLNAQSISAEIQGLLGETSLNGKQKSFYLLSEEIFDLLKLVHYNKQTVYRFECATALDGSNVSWLSNSAEIKNPYQPNSSCGKITDKINF